MSSFSPSETALSGFPEIRRHWRLLAGWAAFHLLVLLLMAIAVTLVSLGVMAATGSRTSGEMTGEFVGGLLGGLAMLGVETVLVAGLLRTLLLPPEPGFLNLRIGGRELRLIISWAGVWAAVSAPVVVAVVIGSSDLAWPAAAVIAAIAALSMISAYAGLRLSLAAPVAVSERKVGLARSWKLTRGRVLPLLGMAAITVCLLGIVALLGWLLLLVLTGVLFGFANTGLFGGEEHAAASPGPLFFQLAVQTLFAPVWWTIMLTPFARAYQAFSDSEKV